MNEQVDKATYEFLGDLLANPAEPDHSYTSDLRSLVTRFPQSGLLHALLASGDKEHLKHAAVYFDPQVLYKLANGGSLPVVAAEQIVYISGQKDTRGNVYDLPVTETFVPPLPEPETAYFETAEDKQTSDAPSNTFAEEEIVEEQTTTGVDAYFHQEIEDEVYDEIVSIEDIGLERPVAADKAEEANIEDATIEAPSQDNYFVFDQEVAEASVEGDADGVTEDEPVQNTSTDRHFVFEAGSAEDLSDTEQEASNVSRYNDDKMPYTFMWWLDRTRKEHEYIYQPYVNNKKAVRTKNKKREVVDELQQQYFEHMVNTASIKELDQVQKQLQQDQPVKKEQQIIERFIKEEPQIKHASGVKLNNENKAKRSSEDKEELVTETLARIYTEQMLYHKAILTYKKLMLKFPEKSLYFAGQIEQLERKIN